MIGLLALVAGLFPHQAIQAAPRCDDREAMIGRLQEQWGEETIALGLTATGQLLEVLTAANGSTWTLIITAPNGQACVLAVGIDWQDRGLACGPRGWCL
jgi:hypothetical protein